MIDAYRVLGVDPSASQAELKAAHRRLVRRHHPDIAHPDEQAAATRRVQEINVAYGLLRDPTARAEYDRLRGHGGIAVREGSMDVRIARQWDDAVEQAGRWAARWWLRHRARLRSGARRAAARSRRAGLDLLGRVLWLLSCLVWAGFGLAVVIAAQRVAGVDGLVAPPTGAVAGALVGSQRGWQRRLRLAGLRPQRAAARTALLLAAGVVSGALLLDARL